ncbi:hypothetical protein COV22_04700 [Candidatus Woesearchaeota archaeon CG10_big_fil_rev_8_21_14_0_10_47_5]|nr:MAG: hypothetical protein COV22_04700 [Candidatus Woesearchaeota archaeon CG10_big_fil_rev_8_21_14_0_10_47_5]
MEGREVRTHPQCAERVLTLNGEGASFTESFCMPQGYNAIAYQLSKPAEVVIRLDPRHSYDARHFGRFFDAESSDGRVIVTYTKKTHASEDSSDGLEEFRLYIAIRFDGGCKLLKRWAEQHYKYDEKRGSQPASRYVFEVCRLKTRGLVISAGFDKGLVEAEAERLFSNYENSNYEKLSMQGIALPQTAQADYINSRIKQHPELIPDGLSPEEIAIAYSCACNSLTGMLVRGSRHGLLAGLPWFFQFWSRDELISAMALASLDMDAAVALLIKNLNASGIDSRIPNRVPSTETRCADSVGWLFLRLSQLTEKLRLSDSQMGLLEKGIANLMSNHERGGLVHSELQETWMDTRAADRKGFCIEIQALTIASYRLLYELTGKDVYKKQADDLIKRVRQAFWNGKTLLDTKDDPVIRPNPFIAAYACPGLLSKAEWVSCFESLLKALWNEWGGLASVDKAITAFVPHDDSEERKSYHNGDSWFWINNLAALAMHKIAGEGFRGYVKKIISASTTEVLYSGALGHHCEISPSNTLRSAGCFCQAWSDAFYIELVNTLFILGNRHGENIRVMRG